MAERYQAPALSLLLHAALLSLLFASFRHSADSETSAPLIVPVTVVSAANFPQDNRLPAPNTALTSASQTMATAIEPAPQPVMAPVQHELTTSQKTAQTAFNPYLLKSAQFNPAIFSGGKASPPPVSPKEPTTPNTASEWTNASGGGIGQKSITTGRSSSGTIASTTGAGAGTLSAPPSSGYDSITTGKKKMTAAYQSSTHGTISVISVSGDGTTQTTVLVNDHKTLAADIQKFSEMQKQ
ncbi:MAG: hypothetical protein KBA75_06735 [Alphaproteobacteria bacterium]|nr:hypothetical protein [Alphaproteobacteria bacterium]